MFFKNLSTEIRRALLGTLIVGLIFAVLAGASGGFLILWTSDFWGNQTVPLSGDSKQDQRAVVEDSAATEVVAKASPAVVSIVVSRDLSQIYQNNPFGDFFGFSFGNEMPGQQRVGGGTGFIVTTDGMIVTNRHVVSDEQAEYTLVFNDNREFKAKVLARDTLNDIAIIKIEADNLPTLDLGDSSALKIGQTVVAIGNSLGEFSNTVTKGVISGINRRVVAGDSSGSTEVIEEAIQTDAAINPGNSGGPLLDLFGKVIGVNTAVSREGQLIGFAIPINDVKRAVESVQKNGRIVRPFLGVRYILLNEQIAKSYNLGDIKEGALIVRGDARTDLAVVPGSPADKAGIVENDIILEVNGEKVTQNRGLARLLDKYNPGDKIKLKIFHKAERKEVEAELVERE